jgi:hypothetical protein
MPFLLTDSANDSGTKYFVKLINPLPTNMYSEMTFLRKPSFFPSIEYTGLYIRFDQSENGSSLSEDTLITGQAMLNCISYYSIYIIIYIISSLLILLRMTNL